MFIKSNQYTETLYLETKFGFESCLGSFAAIFQIKLDLNLIKSVSILESVKFILVLRKTMAIVFIVSVVFRTN